jgi:hypothetical protein
MHKGSTGHEKPSFVHGYQSRQEIIWITPNEKIPNVAHTMAPLTFLIRVQYFGTYFVESFHMMSKSS